VRAASINCLDLAVYEGRYPGEAPTFPLVQGVAAAGVVTVGSGSLIAGMRVAVKPAVACRRCHWCKGRRQADCPNTRMFGVHRQGGYAEYLSVPRQNVALLPTGLSYADGAAAAHTHAVALRMIRSTGIPIEGTTILVTGAGGALGSAAVQLGSALGARVIAVASSEDQLVVAGEIGASVLVNRTQHPTFSAAVSDATDGAGADVVLDTTGEIESIMEGRNSLARGGRLVLVAGPPGSLLELDVQETYRSQQAIIGSGGSNLEDFTGAYRILGENGIRPVITDRFGLDEVAAAMVAARDRARIGKLVIEIGDDR